MLCFSGSLIIYCEVGDGQFCVDCGVFFLVFPQQRFSLHVHVFLIFCIFYALLSFDFSGRGEVCKLLWMMRAPAEVTSQGRSLVFSQCWAMLQRLEMRRVETGWLLLVSLFLFVLLYLSNLIFKALCLPCFLVLDQLPYRCYSNAGK